MDRRNDCVDRACKSNHLTESMRFAMDTLRAGIWYWHVPSGRVEVSAHWARIAGCKAGEEPKTIEQLAGYIHPEDTQKLDEFVRRYLEGDTGVSVNTLRILRGDQSIDWVEASEKVVAADEQGKPLWVAGIWQDITGPQAKVLQVSNHIASMLMDAPDEDELGKKMREALMHIARCLQVDRAFLWQNVREEGVLHARRLYQWVDEGAALPAEPSLARFSYDEILPDWRKTLDQDQTVLMKRAEIIEAAAQTPNPADGMPLLLVPISIHGEFWGFLGIGSRASARSFTRFEQDTIKSVALMMGSAVTRGDMMKNLVASKEAALDSTRAKSNFLSRMSHEIRTPMNAIIGMNAIARKAEDIAKIRYCLGKIDDASQQLLGIINDVLDISKIEADKLEIAAQEFNFEQMMRKVYGVIQVKAEEKKQLFHIDIQQVFTRYVISDELRVTQVLVNLINNAVKFTPENGRISVRVRALEEAGDRGVLQVEVQDSGIGMNQEQQGRLFSAFEQADNSITRRFGGTGLGLAICKRIVNLMGGDIWVKSEPGVGSTFTFEIKFAWGRPIQSAFVPTGPKRALRILAVDDVEDVRVYIKNILQSFSLPCDIASNGDEAILAVAEGLRSNEPYDIVLLDWWMPGKSGAEVVAEIRRLMGRDIAIIVISVSDWPEIEEEAMRAGIDRFLQKPVLPSALFNTILELTGQAVFYSNAITLGELTYDWKGKTILIAEDIEINREIVMNLLEETHVSFDCAENGAKAVSMFAKSPGKYSAILMDIQMPELDGLDATRLIRTSGLPGAKTVPILAMTSNAFKEDVDACLQAGMNCHVAKPIDIEDMMTKLSPFMR